MTVVCCNYAVASYLWSVTTVMTICRVSLGSESRIYEIGNPRFLDWNETPLVLFTCSGCGLGVVHYVHSVKFSHISPSDYQQCLRYRIQLRKVLLSCRKQIQLDIQIEVFHLPNHTQPPCFFNSETRDAVKQTSCFNRKHRILSLHICDRQTDRT